MPSTFALAPSFKWYFYDAEGRPATGGYIRTYYNTNKTQERPVYIDAAGIYPYSNPIGLDNNGGTPVPMYWENDGSTLYYVEVYDNQDRLITSIDNYPIDGAGGSTPVTTNTDIENFISNGSFQLIDPFFAEQMPISNAPTGETKIAPGAGNYRTTVNLFNNTLGTKNVGWYFIKQGGSGATDSIEFVEPAIGTTPPLEPGDNAPYYFSYAQTGAGDPITTLRIAYIIPDVRSFSGETVNISFDCKASTGGQTSNVGIIQDFGSGSGSISASVDTSTSFTWSTDWSTRVEHDINIPSVNGKNIGGDNSDRLIVYIDIPKSAIGTIFDVTNVQMQLAANKTSFIYEPFHIAQYKSIMDLLHSAIPHTGQVKHSFNPSANVGWIVPVDGNNTIGNVGSSATFETYETRALYILWYTSYNDSDCPVSGGRTGAGSTEAEAITDFNANKNMRIPPYIGRVLASGGPGIGLTSRNFYSSFGTEDVTLTIAQMPSHEHEITRSASGVAPGGVTVNEPSIPGDTSSEDTQARGGDQPHNNIQPTHYLYVHVKL